MPMNQYLMISPQDDLSSIHSVFLENDPKKFTGTLDENKQYRKWGLPACDPQYFGSPRMSLRIINFSGCYEPGEMPEQQFVKILAKRKWDSIQKARKNTRLDLEYTLKISLPTNPPIWRRFKCHNSLSLFKFTDTVLIPLMGWTRNYHTWIYEDPKDGAVLGHSESKAIDHSQIPFLCWDILEDVDIKVGDLLKKEGDKLLWTYDLQQMWEHTIELEDIKPCSTPVTPHCLDGAYHCPPEDSRGLILRGIQGYQREISETFQKGLKFHHKNPVNMHTAEWDWKYFDKAATNSVLEIAETSPESTGGDTRKSIFLARMSLNHSSEKRSLARASASEIEIGSAELDINLPEPTTRKEEDRACVVCKKTENTKKCSRCQQCFYCSRECQRKDWPQHRSNCK